MQFESSSAQSGLQGGGAAEPVIRCEGLTKIFPIARPWGAVLRRPFHREYVTSVCEVSFEVGRGEFFGLLGPNGAGKTTLFKLLAASILPDGGHATVNGFDVVKSPSRVRRTLTAALMFDRTTMGRLSATENLRISAALYGLRGADAERRIREMLDAVSLADVGPRLVETFSAGMRQRLAIARALIGRPAILLLDEPTRSMDPLSAREFRAFLKEEIAGRQGCTILLATHYSEEAFELCDRVILLDRGRIIAQGPTPELVHRFGRETYALWTTEPDHAAFSSELLRRLSRRVHRVGAPVEGWQRLDMDIPGGMNDAAAVLSELSRAGAPVARLERIPLSLADLLERAMQAARKPEAS